MSSPLTEFLSPFSLKSFKDKHCDRQNTASSLTQHYLWKTPCTNKHLRWPLSRPWTKGSTSWLEEGLQPLNLDILKGAYDPESF